MVAVEDEGVECEVKGVSESWRELELHPLVLSAIQKSGFEFPLPIQSYCIPAAVVRRKDVLGAAQTGSGKTLAFGIPIFQRLLEEKSDAATKSTPPGIENPSSAETDPADNTPLQPPSLCRTDGLDEEDEEMLEIVSSDEEELEEIEAHSDDEVDRMFEDPTALLISDKEVEALHSSLGTVYFSDLSRKTEKGTSLKALILTPTRELALQTYQHLKMMSKCTGIRAVPVVGGMAAQKQTRLLNCKSRLLDLECQP